MYKVNLKYFKLTGKWYAKGTYNSYKRHLYEIFEEVSEKLESKKLPGLVEGAWKYLVVIDIPEHEYNYPHLVMPDKLREIIINIQDMCTGITNE